MPFFFTIKVTNPTAFVARDVVLIDPVPDSMILVSKPAGAQLVNGVLTWNLGNLAARGTRTVRMRVKIRPNESAGVKTNAATVTATGVPPASDTARVRGHRSAAPAPQWRRDRLKEVTPRLCPVWT